MSKAVGKAVPLSLGRRAVGDFLRASMSVPTVAIQKDMHIAELAAARKCAQPRPSWCSIFSKAYAKVVAGRPDLRRAFLTFPWERTFEYATTTADVVLETCLGDERILAHARLKHPETWPLLDIDREIAACKEKPLERQKRMRLALRLAGLPRFIRRLAWWYLLNVSASARARHLGTFGVSSVGNWGVDSLRPLSPWISLLHCGVVDPHGKVTVRLTFDHRVLDGSGSASALNEMEQFLRTDILAELKSLGVPVRFAG